MAESELLTCAELARQVYRDETTFRSECERIGLEVVTFVVVTNHVVAIAAKGTTYFLVFRGTDDRKDWRDNIDTRWCDTPSGPVHRGFLRGLDLLWPSVGEELRKATASAWWVTGHSLGGAIATLAAMRMHEDSRQPWIITFGQPAVGSIAFARRYRHALGHRHYRFVNGTDVVPDAPVLAHHVGRERYIDANGREWDRPCFLRKLADAARRGWRGPAFGQLAEHAMEEYVRILKSSRSGAYSMQRTALHAAADADR